MLHNCSQLSSRDLIFAFCLVDEFVQFYHQNAQLAAGMHGKDRGETARAHRDRIYYNSRQQLKDDHNLVRWTVSSVHQLIIERTWKLVCRYRDVLDLNDRRCQSSNDAVGTDTALHKDRAKGGHESAELGILQHHLSIARRPHVLPIGAHMVHAFAYFVATHQQRAIIHAAHQPVYHRTESLQLQMHVRFEYDI